jgi:hypothetical protein
MNNTRRSSYTWRSASHWEGVVASRARARDLCFGGVLSTTGTRTQGGRTVEFAWEPAWPAAADNAVDRGAPRPILAGMMLHEPCGRGAGCAEQGAGTTAGITAARRE